MNKSTTQQNGKKHIPFAVIGLVDIVSSSKISNAVDVGVDWEIKVQFLNAAHKRAVQTEMMILNHTGDGFLFIANQYNKNAWVKNLTLFHKLLVADFKAILAQFATQIQGIESGLRFGVSAGEVILGQLDHSLAYTAVGSEVNLAARLCATAEINEMVLSSNVWKIVSIQNKTLSVIKKSYTNLKGFTGSIPAFHVTQEAEEVVSHQVEAEAKIETQNKVETKETAKGETKKSERKEEIKGERNERKNERKKNKEMKVEPKAQPKEIETSRKLSQNYSFSNRIERSVDHGGSPQVI